MAQTRLKDPPDYGGVPFTLEASDVTAAISMGILHSNVPVQQTDATAADYGVAYNRRDNIGTEFHASQRAIQDLCKEFSRTCGFQLKVASFSAKRNGSGNAKYVCKKLNGQQFFDKNASEETLSCPFFINVSGVEGFWKATRANFCHNHVKRVGFSSRPVAEGSVPLLVKDKRNTTQNVEELARLVETEMLPLYEGKLARVKGTAIAEFLKGKGFTLGPTAISRVKQAIEATHEMGRLTSYQKLESYLKLMTEKNPGSLYKFEKEADGTFKRACFFPNIGIRMATMGRRLYGVDGAHLKGEMNNYGVFLVATAKDYDNHILPFGFSMVLLENFDNWLWFLQAMKQALNIARFTLISDRQKGLLSAVPTVFPEAGHRFCLRHIKSNINSKGISLTGKERGLINDMARSDCENDYKLFEKQLASTKPGAVEYLRGIDKKHWVKFAFQEHFKLPTYNETTSNLAEQSNNWIGDECRSAKPLEAFGIYFRKLSELVSNRRQMAANWMMKAPGSQLARPDVVSRAQEAGHFWRTMQSYTVYGRCL